MDDFLKQALDIVKAQASVRVMTEDEIIAMVRSLSIQFRQLEDMPTQIEEDLTPKMPPAKSIKEKSITCLECGKNFKIITKKHLAIHDLDAESYRNKWGLKKNCPLVCKELQRERRKKMKEMKLWERRKGSGTRTQKA